MYDKLNYFKDQMIGESIPGWRRPRIFSFPFNH